MWHDLTLSGTRRGNTGQQLNLVLLGLWKALPEGKFTPLGEGSKKPDVLLSAPSVVPEISGEDPPPPPEMGLGLCCPPVCAQGLPEGGPHVEITVYRSHSDY